MVELSDSNLDHSFKPRKMGQLDQLLSLLQSREDTLAFLTVNLDQLEAGGINSAWATDLFWAAYYGDYDLAESIIEKGTSADQDTLLFDMTWFNYPIINPLKNTTFYKRLIKSVKLDEFWRENGFPGNCRPIGDDDFACN